jgi:hypothetical protein
VHKTCVPPNALRKYCQCTLLSPYSLLVTGLPSKFLLWGCECVYKGPWYACSTRNREPIKLTNKIHGCNLDLFRAFFLPTGPRGIMSRPFIHLPYSKSTVNPSPLPPVTIGLPKVPFQLASLIKIHLKPSLFPMGAPLKHSECKVGEGCLFSLHPLEATACYSNTIYSGVVLKMDYLSFWTLFSLDSATLKSHVLGHAVNIYTLLRHYHVL